MKKTTELTLVKGKYTEEEAKEILMDLFHSKINFHEIKNFSFNERFGKNHDHSINRMSELRESIEVFSKLIANAEAENKSFTIESSVKITID